MLDFATDSTGILAARASSLAARSHSFTTSSSEAIGWVEPFETIPIDRDPETVAEILTNIGSVYYEGGRYRQALDLYRKAMASIQASGAMHIWPRAATHMHMLLVEMGNFSEARRLESEIRSGWNENDARHHMSTLEGNVALMHFHLGDMDSAKKHAQISLDNSEMYVHRVTALAVIGMACLDSGQLAEATKCAAEITGGNNNKLSRFGDVSYAEIFLARWHARYHRVAKAAEELRCAIGECEDRDIGGWLRMRLELAFILRRSDPYFAESTAMTVRERALAIGAAPTVARADALLARLS
jgi:tetratricopeptide (TPR) repeat protein